MGPIDAFKQLGHRPDLWRQGMVWRLRLRGLQLGLCSLLSWAPGPAGLWALRRRLIALQADQQDLAELQALAALLRMGRG